MKRVVIAMRGVPPGLLGLGGHPVRRPRPAYRVAPRAPSASSGATGGSRFRLRGARRAAGPAVRGSLGAVYDYGRVRASGRRVVQVLPVAGHPDLVAVFWDAGPGLPGTGPVLVGRRFRVRGMTAREFVERFYGAAGILRVPHYTFYKSRLILDSSTFRRLLGMTGARLEGPLPI